MRYVPRGFDAFLGNGGGHYLGARFVARGMGFWGVSDGPWTPPDGAYTTAVVGNATAAWVSLMVSRGQPFFAMMAPKAPHEPFMPASWYAHALPPDWPAHEPRPQTWNATAATRGPRHGNLRTQRPLSAAAGRVVSGVFHNRWRTLLSVDDAVAAVVAACGSELQRTFVIYSSDNGFTLGELGMLMEFAHHRSNRSNRALQPAEASSTGPAAPTCDARAWRGVRSKRHVYDMNTRVPLLIRGPGIVPGSVLRQPATHVDLAPTLLDMAGVLPNASLAPIDGRSLLPLLVRNVDDAALGRWARRQLAAAGDARSYASSWRRAVLIEHLFHTTNLKCVSNCSFAQHDLAVGTYPSRDVWCADVVARTSCWATPGTDPEWSTPQCKLQSDLT
jgi:arylsulfatase A-like enzyme